VLGGASPVRAAQAKLLACLFPRSPPVPLAQIPASLVNKKAVSLLGDTAFLLIGGAGGFELFSYLYDFNYK
jgi:hypothetical protein